MVEQHEAEHPPPKGTTNYYFLDQFSLNQHEFVSDGTAAAVSPHVEKAWEKKDDETREMQRRIVDALKAQMLKSGHVLMCLWPWQKPTPLCRAWCLFELWVALDSDIRLSMCFGRHDASAMYAEYKSGSFDAAEIVGEIHAENAGCLLKKDKDLILGLIASTVGVDTFNENMQAALLKAIKGTMAAVIAQMHSRGR